MKSNIDKLEDFLSYEENFIVKLRWMEGLDKENINAFLSLLDDIGAEIKDHKLIEKRIAYFLPDE